MTASDGVRGAKCGRNDSEVSPADTSQSCRLGASGRFSGRLLSVALCVRAAKTRWGR